MTNIDACSAARERMQALLDGPLAPVDEAALESHAGGCAACREALADFRRLETALSGWPRLAPSEGFANRVLASIRGIRPAPRPLPTRVVVAITAIAAALTGLLLAPPTREALVRLLAAGTERGASDAVIVSRAFVALLTAVVPLFERAAALLAPLVATVKAVAIAALHVSAGPLGLAAAVLVALAAGIFVMRLLNPRERRGLHVLVF